MVVNLGGGSAEEARLMWRLAGMGFQFGTEIIAGVLLGWGVDRLFHTNPWGILIGAILGILVAMSHFIRQAVRLNREMDRTKAKQRTGSIKGGEQVSGTLPPGPADRGEFRKFEDEEELTHEQWKALRDRELEPNPNDDDER